MPGPFYVGAGSQATRSRAEPRAIHKNRTANVGNQTDAAPKTGSLALTEVLPNILRPANGLAGLPPGGAVSF